MSLERASTAAGAGAGMAGGWAARLASPDPRRNLALHLLLTQAAWFALVLGAAHGHAAAGLAAGAAVVAWHLACAPDLRVETWRVLAVSAAGATAETLRGMLGLVAYAGEPQASAWPPAWLVMLWAVFAVSLDVSLRWLRGRAWMAALLGAVAGPAAFASGARLGAAHLVEPVPALAAVAVLWAAMLPLVVALAQRIEESARARALLAAEASDA